MAGAVAGVAVYKLGKTRKGQATDNHNNHILILVNHEVVIYNFRLELVERLLKENYKVHISTPAGERVDKLKSMGAIIHDISFDRHGMNPIEEFRILTYYCKLMREVQPLIVFAYTIKPNIYGAMAANVYHIPFVANITGLGTAVENGGWKSRVMIQMYRLAFGGRKGRIQRVFFQNESNAQFFKNKGIALDKHGLLPGSGVNTDRFPYSPLPPCGDGKTGAPIKFAFISRIMKEKGIEQYLDAAEAVKEQYSATEFHIAGFFEPEYDRHRLDELCRAGVVIYDGNIEDVSGLMSSVHCIVHPTYYPEGISNVLLEACSTGRTIITTDRAGCREVCRNNGFLVAERDSSELIEAIERFIELDESSKSAMGKAGRELVKKEFSREIVVNAYMYEVHETERS